MQAIREDYASVVASAEAIKRSENDLEAKHENRREVEAKVSVSNEKQQQNSDQVDALTVHAFIHETCEGVCDAHSRMRFYLLVCVCIPFYLRFENGSCVFRVLIDRKSGDKAR